MQPPGGKTATFPGDQFPLISDPAAAPPGADSIPDAATATPGKILSNKLMLTGSCCTELLLTVSFIAGSVHGRDMSSDQHDNE